MRRRKKYKLKNPKVPLSDMDRKLANQERYRKNKKQPEQKMVVPPTIARLLRIMSGICRQNGSRSGGGFIYQEALYNGAYGAIID